MVTITAHLRVDSVPEFYHSKVYQSKVSHYLDIIAVEVENRDDVWNNRRLVFVAYRT